MNDSISKEEIIDDLREGLREVKLVSQGKVNLQKWEEFKHELHCKTYHKIQDDIYIVTLTTFDKANNKGLHNIITLHYD